MVLEHRPDAIVYYGGHNEYYGAFGAGSSVGVPGSDGVARLFLRLQRLRIVRLANHLIGKARRAGTASGAADASFMGAVARDRAIAFDGPVYARGVAQYEANLTRIVRAVRRAGVPTLLYGPGDIDLAHAADEWVSLDASTKVAQVLVEATERVLNTPLEDLGGQGGTNLLVAGGRPERAPSIPPRPKRTRAKVKPRS